MPELRSCRVSYQDQEGIKHSVGVTAETLCEAAVLGMKALRAAGWLDAPHLMINVTVRAPETTHTIRNAALAAWLSCAGKSPREQVLKSRLLELAPAVVLSQAALYHVTALWADDYGIPVLDRRCGLH